jgi:DNA uptake protein ComE-like DNA-binding protein
MPYQRFVAAAFAACLFNVHAIGASAPAPAGGFQHPPLGTSTGGPSPHGAPRDPSVKPVDLNNASRAELMKLPGIGADEAERIVKGRPYLSKASLMSQQVLSAPVYDGLRGRVFVGAVKGRSAGTAGSSGAPRVARAASKP